MEILLETGKPDYGCGLKGVERAELAGRRVGREPRDLPLRVIGWEGMLDLRSRLPSLRGVPTCVALEQGVLWLHPCPDGKYTLLVHGKELEAPRHTLGLPKKEKP